MPRGYKSARIHQTAFALKRNGPTVLEYASPQQQAIFEYGPAPLCASGGYGAGKTLGLTRKLLALMDLFPGYRVAVARKVWDDLKKTTMETFFKDCPADAYMFGGRRSDMEKTLVLNPRLCEDGVIRQSSLIWMHLDAVEIEHVINGLEINAFLIDQAEETEEKHFERLKKRLGRWDRAWVPPWLIAAEERAGRRWPWYNRAGIPIPPTYAMLTVNPADELHWIFKQFHEESPEWQSEYRARGYRMFHMPSLENVFLTDQNKQELLASPDEFKRKYVFAIWGNPEGHIHKVPAESLIKGTPELLSWIRQRCTLHRALDHGDSAPTCCEWFAVDPNGNVIVYREYYQPNKIISYHRQRIWELSEDEHYTFNFADPSIFSPTYQSAARGRYSPADEYMSVENAPRETALFWSPGDNNELGTRNRINEYLQVDPERINPFTGQPGSPRLFFVMKNETYPHGCDWVVRQTRSAKRVSSGTDLGTTVYTDEREDSIPDHAYDPLRYFMATRPPVKAITDPRRLGGITLSDISRREKERSRAIAAGKPVRPGYIYVLPPRKKKESA